MSTFKIGDKVRLKYDHPDSHWVVIGIERQSNRVRVCLNQDDATIISIVDLSRCTLIDPLEPYKQAVRQVLLSEEFLLAFGKAIANAPIPSAIQCEEAGKESPKPSIDSIPDGWRELEPKNIPSKGDKFWSDGEWHDLLVDGTVEYEYHGEKFIRKIEPPKPAFAVGDRVRVCKPGKWIDGLEGVVNEIFRGDRIEVKNETGWGFFRASELQPVEASK